MFGFGKKVGPNIGLDINSHTISVLQLEKAKQDLKVVKFSSTMTPPDIVREGLLSDPEAVGQAIRELLDSAGFAPKGPAPVASIGIPGQAVVIRLMPVPKGMPADELNDVVRQEAINNLPFSVEEANIDWQRVPGTVRMDIDGVEREDVLLGAIQKVVVESYQRMADVAKIKLGRLEISSLAAVRALTQSGSLGKDDTLSLIVNIRHDATDITLANKSVPLFSRSVLLGVETCIEAICRSINVGVDEAAAILPKIQLLGVPTVDPRLGQAAQVARSVCSDLTAEVGRSLEFYMSQFGMVRVDQVIICGVGTSIPEIDQFVANRLNLETMVANPFQGIVYDRGQILDDRRAHHTMLMGLVLQADWVPQKTVEIDLNQELEGEGGGGGGGGGGDDEEDGETLEEVDTPWFWPALGIGGAAAALVIVGWAVIAMFVVPGKDTEIANLDNEIAEAKTRFDKVKKTEGEISTLETRKNTLQAIVRHGTPLSVLLETIRDNVPQGLQVDRLKFEGTSCSIAGNCADFTKPAHMTINLLGSNRFSTAEIGYIKRHKDRPGTINFQINGTLSPELNNEVTEGPDDGPAADHQASLPGSGRMQVLDFTASWCNPCQKMKPFVEEAQKRYGDKIEFITVDIDDPKNAALVAKYSVNTVPQLYFLDSAGNVQTHLQGFKGSGEPIMAACENLSKVATSSSPR